MALLSLNDWKTRYRKASGSSQDTRLTAWLSAWEAMFLERIGVPVNDAGTRTLDQATYTMVYGSDDFDMRLQRGAGGWVVPPVVEWSTTTLHSSTDGEFTSSELHASDEYDDRQTRDPRSVRVKLRPAYSFADGCEVQLVGTGGYSTVPDRYVHAFGLALDWFDRRWENLGLRSLSVDNRPTQSFTVEELPPHIVELIDACRMPWRL